MIDITKAIGVKRMPGWTVAGAAQSTIFSAVQTVEASQWTHYTILTDNQHNLPACAGFATANWIECMVRSYHGKTAISQGQQIDGEAIWRKARQMFWSHEPVEGGGLFMDQGFKAAISLGILPPTTVVTMRDANLAELSRLLKYQPVLQGTQVSNGWNNPDKQNGQIWDSHPDPLGGHATCIIGVLKQNDTRYVLFQNSWGDKWGWNGYGLLTEKQWIDSLISPLSSAILPWDFDKWQGWRDFIVTK